MAAALCITVPMLDAIAACVSASDAEGATPDGQDVHLNRRRQRGLVAHDSPSHTTGVRPSRHDVPDQPAIPEAARPVDAVPNVRSVATLCVVAA